jgi:hypothetical protein
MSNLSERPPNGAWLPLEEAKAQGIVVSLIEHMLDGDPDPPMYGTTAHAVEALLVAYAGETRPGILLADSRVLVLTWAQMTALRNAFREFSRLIHPTAKGATRACVVLP